MRPRARTGDPANSHAAARAAAGSADTVRERVLAVLRRNPRGLSDEALIRAYRDLGWGSTDSGIRTRRRELVDAGLVEDSGEATTTVAGRATTVWRAVVVDG